MVRYMNERTDCEKRYETGRVRREHGLQMWRDARSDMNAKTGYAVDRMQIALTEVSFSYPVTGSHADHLTLSIPQGSLAGVCGRRGSGKTTLLKLLGQVLAPDKGSIFIPPQLRVLHVPLVMRIMDDTIADNVFFGVRTLKDGRHAKDLQQKVLDRGWRICERLHFSERLMQLARDLTTNTEEMIGTLSLSDLKLIQLARAFIFDPEVLVIHSPTVFLHEDQQKVDRALANS